MRRITRLRRPYGLSAPATRSPIAPLVGQSPSAPSHNISASPRSPIPRAGLQCPAIARLYSTDKQPQQGQQLPQDIVYSQPTKRSKAVEEEVEAAEEAEEGEEEEEQWKTFVPPPRKRFYTERADLVQDKSYRPALRADGLEVYGSTRDWWESREHWPESADFVGFRAPERARVRDNGVLETAVRRAVVEAFALRQEGREDELVARWPVGRDEEMRNVLGVQVTVSPDGCLSLDGDVRPVLRALEWRAGEMDAADRPTLEPEEAEEYRKAWGKEWKAVSLADPRIRFAVTKRVFQLTGHLVQDFQLSGIVDVKTLLHVVQKPPKPKTLTMEIQEKRQDLVQLPNVSVATKRITRGDKAKAIGRYKLVEEEYKKRDLPLVGHGFASKNTDIQKFKGGV